MQISKSQIIKSVCFIVVLLGAIAFINYLLVPYSSMMKRFRGFKYDRSQKKIEALVLGSSEEFDGFDADLMTETLGLNSAVFCVQGGLPQTSYYCLLDALPHCELKVLIVGYSMLENFVYPHKVYPTNRQAQMYREMLKDSKDNPMLLKTAIKQILDQRYTFSFFEYAAFPENITKIKESIKSRKMMKEPWVATEVTSKAPMSKEHPRDLDAVLSTTFTTSPDLEQIEYIKKIKQICEEKNIELYFISCCYPDCVINSLPDFESIVQADKKVFEDLNINFIDTYNENYFPEATRDENFHDCWGHHVMKSKLEYSKSVCQWILDNTKLSW